MERIRLLIITLCLLSLLPAIAQVEGPRSFGNPVVLDRSIGLSSNVVNDALFDADGVLWIATTDGLYRFNGTQFENYRHDAADSASLPYNEMNRLALAADGTLWVGTAQGLCRFDRHQGVFHSYLQKTGDEHSMPNDYVTSLLVDRQDRVWVGTYTGGLALYRPESDDFLRILQPRAPNSYLQRQQHISVMIVQDPVDDERFYIATAGGLLELDAQRMEFRVTTVPPVGEDDRLNDDRNTLRRILVCPNGDLLITTGGAGVHRYVPSTGNFTTYAIRTTASRSRTLNHMNEAVADTDGTIYVSSKGGGLAVLDTLQGSLELLEPGDRPDMRGITGIGITGLKLDPDGTMLMFTDRDLRIFSSERERFLRLELPTGSARYVNKKQLGPVLALNNDEVLVGGEGLDGLYRVKLTTGEFSSIIPAGISDPQNREYFTTQALLRVDEHVLVLAENGLYRLDLLNDRLEMVDTDLHDRVEQRHFLSMDRHPSGHLYIGSRHDGLFRLGADLRVIERVEHRAIVADGIIGTNMLGVVRVDPEGRVWVTTERGLSVFDPRTGQFRSISGQELAEVAQRPFIIADIAFDTDGGLWLVDHRIGMIHIVDRRSDPWMMEASSAPPHFTSGRIADIYIANDGSQWTAGAERSVGRSGEEHSYGAAHGLPNGMLRNIAELTDGRIVATSGMQLTWQRTAFPKQAARAIKVELRELRILGDRSHRAGKVVPSEGIELRYDQRFFTLRISGIDVLGLHAHSLEYELHPFNGEWVSVGPDELAAFTNVPAGDYHLRVRAVSEEGTVIGELNLPLTVLPPFWGTWWFRSAIILLVLGITYALFRYRVRTVRKEATLKAEFNTRLSEMELTALRAQMNPHFLFNSLNSIRHHVLNSNTEAADRYLSKFARLIRLILDHSDQSLVPLSDELQALRLYLELEAARFDDKFDFRISVDPNIGADTTMVPPMLIQPFLENAVWHGLMQKAEGGSIDLRISQEGRQLMVVIEDDGIGRARAAELKSRSGGRSRSRGISITQQRLEMLAHERGSHHEVQVEDLVLADGTAGGTRVTLTIPLN